MSYRRLAAAWTVISNPGENPIDPNPKNQVEYPWQKFRTFWFMTMRTTSVSSLLKNFPLALT